MSTSSPVKALSLQSVPRELIHTMPHWDFSFCKTRRWLAVVILLHLISLAKRTKAINNTQANLKKEEKHTKRLKIQGALNTYTTLHHSFVSEPSFCQIPGLGAIKEWEVLQIDFHNGLLFSSESNFGAGFAVQKKKKKINLICKTDLCTVGHG